MGRIKNTHNISRTKLYHTWANMLRRCYDIRNPGYAFYGAKGVRVCEEWKKPLPFYDWAHANGYADGLSIDRIDPDKDYCPDNCHWVTRADNSRRHRPPQAENRDTMTAARNIRICNARGDFMVVIHSRFLKNSTHGIFQKLEDAIKRRDEILAFIEEKERGDAIRIRNEYVARPADHHTYGYYDLCEFNTIEELIEWSGGQPKDVARWVRFGMWGYWKRINGIQQVDEHSSAGFFYQCISKSGRVLFTTETMEEMAENFDVTRERIRQVVAKKDSYWTGREVYIYKLRHIAEEEHTHG
jgi:hypothetical protein